jgi:hypothetical protein
MSSHITRPINGKVPKSSREARRLIRAAVTKFHSQRAAAWALRLPNTAQLNRMLHGSMHDSPAMRAALVRAKKRAERAYYMIPNDGGPDPLDVEVLRAALREVGEQIEALKRMIKQPSPEKAKER